MCLGDEVFGDVLRDRQMKNLGERFARGQMSKRNFCFSKLSGLQLHENEVF